MEVNQCRKTIVLRIGHNEYNSMILCGAARQKCITWTKVEHEPQPRIALLWLNRLTIIEMNDMRAIVTIDDWILWAPTSRLTVKGIRIETACRLCDWDVIDVRFLNRSRDISIR